MTRFLHALLALRTGAICFAAAAQTNPARPRPYVRERFAVMGIEVAPATPAELAAFVKSGIEKWARLTQAAGMLPE